MEPQTGTGILDGIEAALQAQGLLVFGGFRPEETDRVPPLPDGRQVATLLVVGNAGPAAWQAFAAAPEAGDGAPDPMDRWSKRVLGRLAGEHGGMALFPSDGPPYPPFVAWAKRAAPVRESPLGMLIHPVYGLWHAYRGALALAQRLPLPLTDTGAYPCDACADKPCLTACPVSAFRPEGYGVADCVGHIQTPAGADCMALGCRARRACPVGRAYVYDPPQAAFHMEAFLGARRMREVGGGR
ncbi:MAG: ferredoxin [Kiloniellales bacterium]|nr:ferredoxin [Kiloniellales bacterium]